MSNSIEYKVGVTSCDEWTDTPEYAEFEISKTDAEDIIRMSKFCAENGWYQIEKFDYRVEYFDVKPEPVNEDEEDECEDAENEYSTQDELRVDCCTLSVCDDVFWFSARIKHTDIQFRTETQSISEMATHFGINLETGA